MKRVIAAIDFSDSTDPVVDQAIALAGAFQAELVLIHVAAPDPEFVGYDTGPQSVRDQLAEHYHQEHRHLQDIENRVRDRVATCRSLLIQGSTVEKLLDEVSRLDAGMVVMGSHGHGALHHLLMGSATEGILRQSPVPVVVVPCRTR